MIAIILAHIYSLPPGIFPSPHLITPCSHTMPLNWNVPGCQAILVSCGLAAISLLFSQRSAAKTNILVTANYLVWTLKLIIILLYQVTVKLGNNQSIKTSAIQSTILKWLGLYIVEPTSNSTSCVLQWATRPENHVNPKLWVVIGLMSNDWRYAKWFSNSDIAEVNECRRQ